MSNGFGMQFGGSNSNGGDGKPPTGARPHTAGQVSTYMKLCKTKKQVPQNLFGKSYDEVSAMIQELIEMTPGASESQMSTILEMTERLMKIIPQEHHARLFNQQDMVKLTVVTAGHRITELRELTRKAQEFLPITQEQIQQIVPMYPCPDVNFESLDIPNRIDLGYKIQRADGTEVDAWRLLTPDELVQMLSKKTAQDVMDFMRLYRDPYREWRKTRMSQTTYDTIRMLEKQMVDMSGAGRELTQATDIDGNNFTIAITQNADRTRFDTSIGYEPMSDLALQQLSQDEAIRHIDMLRSEIYRSERYKRESDELNPQVDTRDAYLTLSKRSQDWSELNNILHSLLAVAGHEDEELLNACIDVFDDKQADDLEIARRKAYIRRFMRTLVTNNDITVDGLLMIIDRSTTAKEILLGV